MRRLLFALALFCVSAAGWSAEYPVLVKDPLGFPVGVSGLTVDDTGTTFTITLPMNLSDAAFDSIFSDLDVGQLIRKDKHGNIGGGRNIYLGPKDAPAALLPGGTFNGLRVISSDDQEILEMNSTANDSLIQGYTSGGAVVDFSISTSGLVNQQFNNSAANRDFSIGVNGIANFFNLDSSDPSMNIGAGHVTIGSPSVENAGAGDLNVGDDLYVDGGLEGGNSGVTSIAFNASGDFIFGEGVLSGGDALAWDQSAGELYVLDGASTEVHLISVGGVEINRAGAAIQSTISSDNLDVITVTAADELDLLGNIDWDAGSVTGNASTGEWTFASEIQATAGVQAHTYLELFKSGNTYGVQISGFANPVFEMSGSASTGDTYIKAENPLAAGGDIELHAHGDDDYVSVVDGIFEMQEAFAYWADSPAQITSNQNDYNMGYTAVIRLSTDASRDITGIAYKTDGQRYEIWNVGSNDVVLKHQDTNSSAANRIICNTGADITLSANEGAVAWYDSTTSRWRLYKV